MTYQNPITPDPAAVMPPRAIGALRLAAKRRGAASVIADLRQEGSLKALFPRSGGDAPLQAVFLNTAGGLTGGDQMELQISAGQGAHIVLSSQAAERGYAALGGQVAQVDVTLRVGAGARIDWLPQETILFDRAALRRRLQVHLAPDSRALLVEPVIFGRVAMSEVVRDLNWQDHWRIWRDGRLIYADNLRMQGDAQALLARGAIGAGAGALATLVLAAQGAAALADALVLPDGAGASALADDLLVVRLLAADGFTLRRDLIGLIETLSAAPIPRVWRL